MRRLVLIAGTALALALTGCQTNRATYKGAFDQAGQRNEPKIAAEEKPPKPIAAVLSDRADQATESASLEDYKLDDLDPGQRPDLASDEGGLWLTMDRAEERLKTSGRLVKDPALNAYVRDLTCRLAGPYCKDIRVYILRVPYFNASMAPNGAMQVWTGALLRVQNEAQLATILSHEIGHYLRRHSLQRYRAIINQSGALLVFQLATAVAGAPIAGDVAALAILANLQSFNRDQEREADGYGLHLMYEQNYDPNEAHKIWDRLIAEVEATKDEDRKKRDPFFASHPPSEERRDALKKFAAKIADDQHRVVGRDRYAAAIAPYLARFLEDDVKLHEFDRSKALLDMLATDGTDGGLVDFFKGELHRLRNQDDDLEAALADYQKALSDGNPPADVYHSMGIVLRKLNRHDEAKRAFATYLQRRPNAEDAEFIQYYIDGDKS